MLACHANDKGIEMEKFFNRINRTRAGGRPALAELTIAAPTPEDTNARIADSVCSC
ncbi:hypothetical protein D3C81_2043170 [compost metagenome]